MRACGTEGKPSHRKRQEKNRPVREKIQVVIHLAEPPHTRLRLTKWERQEEQMLTLTVLKSVILVAGLALASVFLQSVMTYGKLPLIIGQ